MLVDVGGRTLDVAVTPAAAPSPRPPLVFLHEGLGSIQQWRTFPSAVRTAVGGPAMLVYSRAGYGRSGPAELPRPVDYMHEEADVVLPALLAHLDLQRPVLVGHSDGASIALLHAGGGHDVAALVLLAPHVFVEDVSVASIAGARDAFATTDLPARLGRYHDDPEATFRGWNDVWLSPAFRSWNIEERLPAIRAPVPVVQGADDPYGTTAQLDAVGAGVPGPVERLVLPGVGHAPHLDAPEAVLRAVVGFVAGVS